ncbi:MAG TPA: hypothetical protein ENH72_00230 [Pseudomonas sabulinigri]|uniref:Carboxylesterase type B domain-containing protein n=1 Tax=marine sediment metagenome TaxID=412755 RepID=A0A0F9UJ23_9ZZZZ|nr:hypothetical protein [Halopseudomonas sabulinigri]HEC52019.1 hypothetical protein [Halopseudomonas sabulinigri]
MTKSNPRRMPSIPTLVFPLTALALAISLTGCFSDGGGDDDSDAGASASTGVFMDSPVGGLHYQSSSHNGTTSSAGEFQYNAGESLTFSIGDLELGSASGAAIITPLDLVEDATDVSNNRVNNLAVLLQTLDQDAVLNNGILITEEVAAIVANHVDSLDLDQPSATFPASLAALLTELNEAEPPVFTDTDPRPRSVVSAAAAREHMARSLAPGKVVETEYGQLSGFQHADGTWAWYGIPYAKPPLDALRWKPPVEPEAWEGVRYATAWANQSAQTPAYQSFGEGGMSEDSLYLNVTVPDGYAGEELPVMVWFHGGGFAILTGNTKAFNNTSLPKEGVIVVTVNHRLGPFGYMAHPALTAESSNTSSGNYGQLDLVAALKWVKNNIAAFGGDPDNVTIFGESGGGGKVLSLINSPLAKGLFHKAIVQSGMAGPADVLMPVENPLAAEEQDGVAVAEKLGVQSASDVAAAMRSVPWVDLVNAANASGRVFSPNVDGYYMTDGIRNSFESGTHNDVPVMAGANEGDTPGLIEGFKWYMPWMADYNDADVYAYVFDHLPDNWAEKGSLAYHGSELVYVFDYPGSFVSHYLLGLTGIKEVGSDVPTPAGFLANHPGWKANDVYVTETMRDMWANFARTGNPSTTTIDWDAYTSQNDSYLRITEEPTMQSGVDSAFPAPAAK